MRGLIGELICGTVQIVSHDGSPEFATHVHVDYEHPDQTIEISVYYANLEMAETSLALNVPPPPTAIPMRPFCSRKVASSSYGLCSFR